MYRYSDISFPSGYTVHSMHCIQGSPSNYTKWLRLALYLGSMLRSTVALHNLINNKMKNKKEKAVKAGDSGTSWIKNLCSGL